MNRDFKGVWIPRSIWLSKNLSLQEKVFLIEIESLDNEEKGGCYAGNKYFSEFFGLSESRVSSIIKTLVDKKVITRKITRTQTGSIRFLKVSHYVKTAIAHSQEITISTSQIHYSQSAKSDNRIIHINNPINNSLDKKRKLNPRKS